MHAWKIAQQEIDVDEYSALIAVGGDGTLHEVVNGLMFRKDKKRIPVAFIPNGSGNDTCKAIGVHSIEQALEYIQKGDLLKVDLNRVWIDADTFEEIENSAISDDEKFKKQRYSIINASTGFVAKTVHAANKVKSWAGSASYLVAGIKSFFQGVAADNYRVSIYNQQKLSFCSDMQVLLFFIMNGKYGGGGMPLAPACLMNDGLFDVAYYNRVI